MTTEPEILYNESGLVCGGLAAVIHALVCWWPVTLQLVTTG